MSEVHEEPRVFKPGDVFRDHYTIVAFLGAGASGQVYRVLNRYTGEHLALKVGHLVDRGSARQTARRLIEGRAGFDIQHRNVVHVSNLGCEDDGTVWILMELLQGNSIGQLLARFGRFSPIDAIDIALEIAAGLQAAHELQIIHRDIQPANVYLTWAGVVKILDFSLAKVIPAGFQTTEGSRSKCTAPYASPEQLRGGAIATAQFDVFAVGMLLWTMLVGRHPFERAGENIATIVLRQFSSDPESLVTAAGLPACCDEVIRGAMARDPRERYLNMWQLSRALTDLRARLVADLAAERVYFEPSPWASQCPVVRDGDGHHQYSPPASLPRERPTPPQPSRRIVVAEAVPAARRVVAATVPMPVAEASPAAPAPRAQAPVDVGAPTVRAPRVPLRPRRLWLLLLAPAALLPAGVGLWLMASAAASTPAAPRTSSVAAAPSAPTPRAPASAAPATPRRPTAARPGP